MGWIMEGMTMIFNLLALAATAVEHKITEPVITWNLFFTAILVPFSLWILYKAIDRNLIKKDKLDDSKDLRISELVKEREVMKDKADNLAHEVINNKLEVLHTDIVTERLVSKEARDEIFDKLSKIDVTLTLINGSVKKNDTELRVHIAESK